ncbi:MAG: carboxypeptidase-like regulatory domain-containing protein [Ignavibacteriota bacterium]
MSPGTYFVKSERDAESNDYKQVVVAAGADVALDFTVPANVTLSGRVLDPDGKPVAEASVYLLTLAYRNGLLGPVLSGPKQTHADGVYLFDYGLQPNRKYYVLVDRKIPEDLQGRDTIEVPTYHPSAHSFAEALPIALQNGEQRSGVDIQIARAPFFCVAGKILEGSGSFSIQESALAGSALKHAAGKVDSEGNYRVCGITSGDYRLSEQNAFTSSSWRKPMSSTPICLPRRPTCACRPTGTVRIPCPTRQSSTSTAISAPRLA